METLVEYINGDYCPVLKIGTQKFALYPMDTMEQAQLVADLLCEAIVNKTK